MFELPEIITLAGQINETVTAKVIKKGSRGNTPHKFVWYNRTPNEFGALTRGKTVGKISRANPNQISQDAFSNPQEK